MYPQNASFARLSWGTSISQNLKSKPTGIGQMPLIKEKKLFHLSYFLFLELHVIMGLIFDVLGSIACGYWCARIIQFILTDLFSNTLTNIIFCISMVYMTFYIGKTETDTKIPSLMCILCFNFPLFLSPASSQQHFFFNVAPLCVLSYYFLPPLALS